MKNKFACLVGCAVVACLSLNGSARAAGYSENGDAGDLPATSQAVFGPFGTALTSVTGALTLTNQTSDSDMFEIYVNSPSTFSASLTGFVPGSNNFDSQLMIFSAATGRGIQADDDDPTSGSSSANLPSGSSLMSMQAPGFYYLLVSGSGRYATSSTGLIFPNYTDGSTDPSVVYGPSGSGGANAISGYTGSSNEGGAYSIALTGAQFIPAVPEPSSVLLALAAAGGLLGLARQRA